MSLLFLCISSVTGVAQTQASPSPAKPQNIVTLSFNAAVLQTSEAQKSLSNLQTRFAPRQQQLKALNDDVESLRKQLANTSSNLSDSERVTRAQSLETKEKQLQRAAEDFKSDSQSESEQVFQRVAQKVYAFLQTFSQQHGYSAVIERGSDANPVVWYASTNIDITDELIKAYNAQVEGASSAPANGPAHGGLQKSSKPLPDSPSPN
jgi:outer membrane protein